MRRKKLWLWGLAGALAVLLVVFGLLVHFRLEQQWFAGVGYTPVFWRTLLWKTAVSLGIFGLVFGLGYFSLHLAFSRAGYQRRKLPAAGLAALFAFFLWTGDGDVWFSLLQALNAVAVGTADPQFGLDIGFYVFQLPFLELLQRLLGTFLTLHLLAALAIYLLPKITGAGAEPAVEAAEGGGRFFRINVRPFSGLEKGGFLAGWKGWGHCGFLLGALVMLQAAGQLLGMLRLMYDQGGIVGGAGATDIAVRLPAAFFLAALSLLIGLVVMVGSRRYLKQAAIALAVYAGLSLLLQGVIPGLYQQFVVDPNEISREQPYIQRNIEFTSRAYRLDQMEEREYPVGLLSLEELTANRDVLEHIRILDQSATHTTYSQQQELRRYYHFADVDVDRYTMDGKYTQVMVAAREMDQSELPEQSQNFNNRLFQYTHGFGLAMSPANKVTSTGLPDYLIKDIPPVSRELNVVQPRIYYGEATANNVIVRTKLPELDYTDGDQNKDYLYEGEGGIPMTFLNRLLLSLRDMEYRYLFSGYISGQSLYLETRNVTDRAARLAPFLSYDKDPYIVLTAQGDMVYMLDAYTHTGRYPYSQAYDASGMNYLRNSVKVTVNAYSGETVFYLFDPEDPIAAAYAKIYPDLFKAGETMPEDLKAHVRYPEAMFQIQSRMLQDYHMSSPMVFYNREDRWAFADQIIGTERKEQDPYYTISRLPGEEEPEFVLLRNFTPYGRDNMVAWLAGRSDGENYGKLLLYTFSKGSQIMGPMQVESQIDQDPEISGQLSLWGQGGSTLIRGNMLVYPLDDALLYVEPLYLSSDTNRYPQLLRLFVYYNDRIVMAAGLEEAIAQLFPGYGETAPEPGPETEEPSGQPEPTGPTGPETPGDGGQTPPQSGGPAGEAGSWAVNEAIPLELRQKIGRLIELQKAGKAAMSEGDWAAYGAVQEEMTKILEELDSYEPE
jgi:uncharacterized membrane protein (UPF0182 family)